MNYIHLPQQIPQDIFYNVYKQYAPQINQSTTSQQSDRLLYLQALALSLINIITKDVQLICAFKNTICDQLQKKMTLKNNNNQQRKRKEFTYQIQNANPLRKNQIKKQSVQDRQKYIEQNNVSKQSIISYQHKHRNNKNDEANFDEWAYKQQSNPKDKKTKPVSNMFQQQFATKKTKLSSIQTNLTNNQVKKQSQFFDPRQLFIQNQRNKFNYRSSLNTNIFQKINGSKKEKARDYEQFQQTQSEKYSQYTDYNDEISLPNTVQYPNFFSINNFNRDIHQNQRKNKPKGKKKQALNNKSCQNKLFICQKCKIPIHMTEKEANRNSWLCNQCKSSSRMSNKQRYNPSFSQVVNFD